MIGDHKVRGNGPVHDGDCPGCQKAYDADKERRAQLKNPHRLGTKVHDRWEKENRLPSWTMYPWSETYWSM